MDAAPGGQPVSFSVNCIGCVRLPVVLSCFVGQVPSGTALSLCPVESHAQARSKSAMPGLGAASARAKACERKASSWWSSSDDQLVAVLWRDVCALYVIESVDGYATSTGDASRTDSFEVVDHDGMTLVVPWADCVAWPVACRALARFAAHGELGPEVAIEGRIPSQLLMHGELDRETMVAMRAAPASDPRKSSLPRLVPAVPVLIEPSDDRTVPTLRNPLTEPMAPLSREPVGTAELTAWGRRLIEGLAAQGLIELGNGPGAPGLDEICYQLSGLLQAHGDEAEHAVDTADWLANEIKAIRGVSRLFATGGDLQIALRRTRVA